MASIHLVLWLAVAVSTISFTLTKTPVFDWVRALLDRDGMLHYLWQCPYCMSHWVSMILWLVYRPMPFSGQWYDLVPCVFIMVAVSTLIVQMILIVGRVVTMLKSFE